MNTPKEFNKYAERINGCSGILKFGFGEDKLVLKQAFFCRVRFCPVCQWRRSLLWRAVMFQKLEEIKTQYPTHRWVFLTLTVRNCDLMDLRDTLKDMNASWKRMSETVAFKKGVAGFIRTTEVTRERMATCEHIPTITPYCWLSLAISQKIILNSLSGSKCGKKP